MLSTAGKVTGPVTNIASPILSQAAALHPAHNVVSVAIPVIGTAYAAAEHWLDPIQKSMKMASPGADINADPNAREKGTSIKARKVRKILKTTHIDIEELFVQIFQDI